MSKRVFYACQALGFAKDGTTSYVTAHGVQSAGISTNFNLEQVFEVGQLAIYDLIEQIPEVQVTAEKVLDGYPLLYHLATNGATNGTLVGRSNVNTIVALGVWQDTQDSASGESIAEVEMSGMLPSSLTYTFPVDGRCTESITLVGNHKLWRDTADTGIAAHFSGQFLDNLDVPLSGNVVQSRWNVVFDPTGVIAGSPTGVDENGQLTSYCTILPTDIYGITSSGTNPRNPDGSFVVPIQSISVSCDLGRDTVNELGRKTFYCRYVTFPVEVRTDIEYISTKWDGISATEEGGQNGAPAGSNLKNQTIRVQVEEGTRVDVGTRNKLQSVTYGGGDAGQGGGNVTIRRTYSTFNTLTVTHPADPSSL